MYNTIMKLKEAYTYFIVPFSFKRKLGVAPHTQTFIPSTHSIWEKACMHNLESNILYPYIQCFMQDAVKEENRKELLHQELSKKDREQNEATIAKLSLPIEQKMHYYQIYSIKESAKKDGQHCADNNTVSYTVLKNKLKYWKMFKNSNLCALDKESEKDIVFNIPKDGQDFNSPKLIISPLAQTGFLMFCMKLNPVNNTSEALTELNYLLHKTGKQQDAKCRIDLIKLQEEISMLQNKMEDELSQKEKENIEKRLLYKQDTLSGICNLLKPESDGSWTMTDLIQFLFDELTNKENNCGNSIVRFNDTRIHLFTYYQLDCTNLDESHSDSQIILDMARIVRCQNQKYKLDIGDVKSSNLCMKTFQNVYMGSSVEGGAIMTVFSDDGSDFFQNFHKSSFSKRYIWIYLMVLMQRYTLLHLIHGLTNVDDDNLKVSLFKLKEQVEHLSAVKVNTYFTDVSDYTQHNQFYRFCIKNLRIQEHFQEIDEKMNILNAVIKHKEEEKEDIRSNRFALILAILTIASASKDGSDLFKDYGSIWSTFIILILSAIVIYIWAKNEFHFFDSIKKYLKF